MSKINSMVAFQTVCSYNYAMAGQALGFDGVNNPDAVASDPVLAFRTALWFWMTPQSPKPSAHVVMAGRWTPSGVDAAAGRTPGFGELVLAFIAPHSAPLICLGLWPPALTLVGNVTMGNPMLL
jgi:hypothetical protein